MAKHLTLEERIKMEALVEMDIGADQIAKQLGRGRSTIYRELQRGDSCSPHYSAKLCQKQARHSMSRNQESKSPAHNVIKIVEEKILNEQWSPEQISNWLKIQGRESVSFTWIYKYIKKDKAEGGELHNHLRRGCGSYLKGHKPYKGKIKDRVSIEARPEIVNQRSRLGDYEIDLIVGPKNKGAILTIVDRLSRECRISMLSGKSSEKVCSSVVEVLPSNARTVTSDNGTEFTDHKKISSKCKLQYYFAHPYASYERGSIENLNGLIRQYIPKGTGFDFIKEEEIKAIEEKLNNRPRKVLDFLTPVDYVRKYQTESRL
ncbi:MAG: IS30 family transposase [bacterium]|nr:IS30 family transposase [bacterium]